MDNKTELTDLTQLDQLFSKRLLEPLYDQWDLVISFMPKLLAALIVMLIGLLIAFALSAFVRSLLRRAGMDKLSRKAGIDAVTSEVGLHSSPSKLIGKIVFWLVFFAALMPATELLGVKELTRLMGNFVAFLPKIIAAVIIIVFGFVIANFLRQSIRGGRDSLGLNSTKTVSGLVYSFTIAITLVIALGQLGMRTTLLLNVLLIIIGSMSFAIALAVGLGGRELAHNLVAGFYAREAFKLGQHIQLGEHGGILKSIQAQNTVIAMEDGQEISIPNSQLFQQPVVSSE